MASDDASVHSYISLQEEYGIYGDAGSDDDYVDSDDPHYHHHHPPPHNSSLSRLSICSTITNTPSSVFDGTTSTITQEEHRHQIDVDDGNSIDEQDIIMMSSQFMTRFSIDSDDNDADDEQEYYVCHSLPATPPHRRTQKVKEYASENEATQKDKGLLYSLKKKKKKRNKRDYSSRSSSGRLKKGRWAASHEKKDVKSNTSYNSEGGGESEGSTTGGGGGLVVITRPKGGRRSLCMGLEEVKACRDLGFELEHERISNHNNNADFDFDLDFDAASSGSSSPLPTWRISSPGDDPRYVKARLKVWAQAVALASSSSTRQGL